METIFQYVPLVAIAALLTILLYLLQSFFSRTFEKVITIFVPFPEGYSGKILPVFYRVVRLNWYSFLLMGILWLLLYFTEVGNDVITAYLDNLINIAVGERFSSLVFIFLFTFLMSLSIWLIPFFMYSAEREAEINREPERFYIGTKLLAFVAMLPFLIVTNAFLPEIRSGEKIHLILLYNLVFLLVFMGLAWISARFPAWKWFYKIFYKLFPFTNGYAYFQIVVKIFILIAGLAIVFALLPNRIYMMGYYVVIYLFLASAIVFRHLFYLVDSEKEKELKAVDHVAIMLSPENKKKSKALYLPLLCLLLLTIFYLYLVPSLEPTNPLYILLIVFVFFIIYLDFWRNVFTNGKPIWKLAAIMANVLFLALPFIKNENQFRIPFSSYNHAAPKRFLEEALMSRVNEINRTASDSASIFIVCAMGGGSRAGFISAAVLQKIDEIDTSFRKQTLCYSTVSGGSVGVYNYNMGIEFKPESIKDFRRKVFQRNYNSSGIFGLLIGDAIETLLNWLATLPRTLLNGKDEGYVYQDRNYRIRKEYDYVLEEAIEGKSRPRWPIYLYRTFFPLMHRGDRFPKAFFQSYFNAQQDSVPIHLVNSFEINSGRRAILSPFPLKDSLVFPNALFPLQDRKFDSNPGVKDISYREAVNLSELFPLISAASNLGELSNAQFVDGGYYENYGLGAALDVYYIMTRNAGVDPRRLKILLIKNSEQTLLAEKRNAQLFAPLVGAMNAPFTGHANQLLEEARRTLPPGNFYDIVFEASRYQVPLTRSLLSSHIDSMEVFIQGMDTSTALKQFLSAPR